VTAGPATDVGATPGAGPAAPVPTTDARRVVPAVLAGLGIVSLLYALVDVRVDPLHDVRIAVTAVFLLLGPGWAVSAFLARPTMAERFLLAAATGTALAILVGQVMVVSGAWYPGWVLLAAVVLTVPVLVSHALRGR
jgi:hypothetical protein